MGAVITAFGAYAPEKKITNHHFEATLDTNDEWIRTRTGIVERRYAEDDQYVSDICVGAAKNLAERYNKELEDVDFIIVASISGEHTMPSIACQVQAKLGVKKCGAIDITAACAGFVYAIQLAHGLVEGGTYKKVLVLGAEKLSRLLDFSDRATCILFGDGAGSALIEASDKPSNVLASVTGSQGEDGAVLYLSQAAKELNGTPINDNNKIFQEGRKVFKWAITTVSKEIQTLCDKAGITVDDIDWLVPHSANMRIIEGIAKSAGIPMEKTLESVSFNGNTSSASIPLAFAKGLDAKKVKKGDKVLFIGFGGGLTYGGTIFEVV